MESRELTLKEIQSVINDMRHEARQNRSRAERAETISAKAMFMGEALVAEHWANRLEWAMNQR